MKKYYFIGIKGSGMSSLAQLLYDYGNEVIGYDDNKNHAYTEIELEKRNIKIYYETPVLSDDTIVVRSSAIRDNHSEIVNAKKLNLKIYEYTELLGEISKDYETVAISGCHGKTTTTALLSHVFSDTMGCSYIIGDGTGKANPNSNLLFIEACEYKRHFLHYYPKYTIITNIELEHVECYPTIEDITNVFQEFVNQTSDLVVACGDNENVRKIKYNKVLFYGLNDNNDVIAKNLLLNEEGSKFDVYINNELYCNFDLPLYGKHMVLNALAVITICYLKGLKKETIKEKLKTYGGAKRRFNETIIGDNILIDDYAHHPTEISATIDSARQKYKDKNIIAIFKPNTYSRTKKLYKDFITSLNKADYAYITDIFCDRELPSEFPGVTSDLIINELNNGEKISNETLDKLLKHKNSVFLFMSCKDIYTMKNNFEKLLKNI